MRTPASRRGRDAVAAGALLVLALLTACTMPQRPAEPAASTAPPLVAPSPRIAATPTPPPQAAAPLPDVVVRAGERLLQDARGVVGDGSRDLVIDPLIDASTGQQTAGTQQLGLQLASLIRAQAPQWTVKPLSRSVLAGKPLLLIGTLTAVHNSGGGRGSEPSPLKSVATTTGPAAAGEPASPGPRPVPKSVSPAAQTASPTPTPSRPGASSPARPAAAVPATARPGPGAVAAKSAAPPAPAKAATKPADGKPAESRPADKVAEAPAQKRLPSADAFRVCLVLIDLASGKLIAKRIDRATVASVDAEPLPLFRESPTWTLDRTTRAYIQSCQGSSPGDVAAAAYLRRLPAAALIAEAQQAYADNRAADAYRLFREARPLAEADDLRVLNGLYVTSWRTGRKDEAAETFGRIVGVGMDAKRLPIKIFFAPGSTRFIASRDLQAQYLMWLKEIALQAGVRENCMRVVGHTSRTGSVAGNDLLSAQRAAAVKAGLERLNRELLGRLVAEGVGSREVMIDLGTDDGRDALDRRVEFRTVDCA